MKRFCRGARASFTLIELLTVIAIIAILAGLTLAAFSGVMKSAGRSRARSEIAAISAAMENYKSDNGAYPASPANGFNDTNYANDASPSAANGLYQNSSAVLYQELSGQTNFGNPAPTWGTKIYMTFKSSQLGNYTATSGNPVYLKDPFGNSYGYFTGSSTYSPINGTNQFDIWSTGGDVASPGVTNTWISNWGMGG